MDNQPAGTLQISPSCVRRRRRAQIWLAPLVMLEIVHPRNSAGLRA